MCIRDRLRDACKNIPNVEVDSFNGLTVSFAKQKGATVMVRGLQDRWV